MLNRQFEIVREDLHRRYDHISGAAAVDTILDDVIHVESANAKVETFLPVIVEREAAEKLEALAADAKSDVVERKEILYVCERNAGRSQLASAITRWLVADKLFVRSVGLHPTGGINPTVLQVLKERGISTEDLYQKVIVPRAVHRSDVVVLMGVDEIPGVPAVRYESWDIEDPEGKDIEAVRKIADSVETHVRALIAELGLSPVKEDAA